PRGEDLLFDWPALTLAIPPGDPAAGVRPLTVLDGEGEEVLALGGALRSHARGQHHRLAVAHDHRAIGLLGHLPGLELERVAVDVNVDGMSHTGFCPRVSAGVRRTPCGASVPAPGPPESCRPRTNQLLIVGSAHRRIPSFSMIARYRSVSFLRRYSIRLRRLPLSISRPRREWWSSVICRRRASTPGNFRSSRTRPMKARRTDRSYKLPVKSRRWASTTSWLSPKVGRTPTLTTAP